MICQVLTMEQESDERLEVIIKRNLEGRRLEKMGFTKDAVELYEKNVAEGDVETESYKRLASIYRDHHDYDNEIRVIESYLELWEGLETNHPASITAIDRFKERLDTVLMLRDNNPSHKARPVSNRIE